MGWAVTENHTNAATSATAALYSFRWSTEEMIYSSQGHRLLLLTSRARLPYKNREEAANTGASRIQFTLIRLTFKILNYAVWL